MKKLRSAIIMLLISFLIFAFMPAWACARVFLWQDGDLVDIYDFLFRIRVHVPPIIEATVDINPATLNLKSKGWWITGYIELPQGYDVNNINVSSILLNATIPAELGPTSIGDYDSDGIPDLMVKFDRAEVISYILDNIDIEERFMTMLLTITGKLSDGTPFQGSDTIEIVLC